MKSNIEEKLKSVRHKGLTQKERSYLWQSIKSTISNNNNYSMNSFSFISILRRSRNITIIFLIALLSFGSYGTVTYADNSTPGDFLFPVDLAVEKVRFAFSSHEKKDELLVKYSEERLDEAKTKIKLVYASITPTQNATSTSGSTSTSTTSTGTTTPVMATSTVSGANIDRAQKTLLLALEHLKANKAELIARGNTDAVLVLDNIIAELTRLAEDQLSTLERVAVEIKIDDDTSKTRIIATSEDIKTHFNVSVDKKNVSIKFETKERENNENKSNSNKNKSSDSGKDNKKNNDRRKDDNDNRNGWNNKNDKENNDDKKVTLCHNNKETITVSVNAFPAHKAHGDTLGKCDNHNDDTNQNFLRFEKIAIAPQTTSTKIKWETNKKSTGTVWFSTSTPVTFATSTLHIADTRLDDDHEVVLTSLLPSTKYHFIILAESDGKTATSTEQSFITQSLPVPPDTTAPIISNLTASTTPTTANLSLNTNEQSVARLLVATSTPVTEEGSFFNQVHGTNTFHSWSVTGLLGNTTYYAIAVARDSNGNTATSSTISFITAPVPDTTAPIISSLSETGTGTTTANILFGTNENSSSKLWFGTSTPLSVSGTPFRIIETPTLSHLYALTDLATSTIYYFIVSATDGTGNTATSTEQNFSI